MKGASRVCGGVGEMGGLAPKSPHPQMNNPLGEPTSLQLLPAPSSHPKLLCSAPRVAYAMGSLAALGGDWLVHGGEVVLLGKGQVTRELKNSLVPGEG